MSREEFKTLYYIILKNNSNKNELKIVPWWASIQIYVSNITELVRVLRWIEVFYPSLQQHVPELVHAGLQGHQGPITSGLQLGLHGRVFLCFSLLHIVLPVREKRTSVRKNISEFKNCEMLLKKMEDLPQNAARTDMSIELKSSKFL